MAEDERHSSDAAAIAALTRAMTTQSAAISRLTSTVQDTSAKLGSLETKIEAIAAGVVEQNARLDQLSHRLEQRQAATSSNDSGAQSTSGSMKSLAPRSYFDKLPLEILQLIFPRPLDGFQDHVLPIGQTYDPDASRDMLVLEGMQIVQTLRSLAQTCSRLRSVALPILWEHVEVQTLEEFGRLRETLRASPRSGSHVRFFTVRWTIDGLDKGLDLENADQVGDSLVEVFSKLTSLQQLTWSIEAPMPKGVCCALAKLPTLTYLHVELLSDVHLVSLWKVATNLEDLLLTVDVNYLFTRLDEQVDDVMFEEIDEQDEAAILSFEFPEELPSSLNDKVRLYYAVTDRTIVTAVRNGHLRWLDAAHYESQRPFAVRALLPHWVGMDTAPYDHDFKYELGKWHTAAKNLGSCLVHASRWYDASCGVLRQTRRLTAADVQDLFPFQPQHFDHRTTCTFTLADKIAPYLPWLAEDLELAERVASAWSVLLQRKKSRMPTCPCVLCLEYVRSKAYGRIEQACASATAPHVLHYPATREYESTYTIRINPDP